MFFLVPRWGLASDAILQNIIMDTVKRIPVSDDASPDQPLAIPVRGDCRTVP